MDEVNAFRAAQFGAAHRLAGAHGHLWAEVAAEAYLAAAVYGISARELCAEHERQTRPSGAIGGLYPAVEHATTSGRLSWRVRVTGAVEVVVWRPSGVDAGSVAVLEALVGPRGQLITCRTRGTRHVVALTRHVDVIVGVVHALGGTTTVDDVVASTGDDYLAARVAAEQDANEAALAAEATLAAERARREALSLPERAAHEAACAEWRAACDARDPRVYDLNGAANAAHNAWQAALGRLGPYPPDPESERARVYAASLAARLKVAAAKREASPEAEERRYQAARREVLARAGVAE